MRGLFIFKLWLLADEISKLLVEFWWLMGNVANFVCATIVEGGSSSSAKVKYYPLDYESFPFDLWRGKLLASRLFRLFVLEFRFKWGEVKTEFTWLTK